MNRSPALSPPRPRHWRDIPQQVSPRAMSRAGRRRRALGWAKIAGAAALLAALGWGGWAAYDAFSRQPAQLARDVGAPPLKETILTDGVLTHQWLVQALGLPPRTALMAVNLGQLREKLLAHGQVRSAVLTRNFPDTLAVTIQERSPVARIQLRVGTAAARPFLVSRDGVIFDGECYNPALLSGLPWLAGVAVTTAPGGGLQPIAGMGAVADLLQTAQNQAPRLFAAWKVVSLTRLDSDNQLVVTSDRIDRIVFSADGRDSFLRQLARLDVVVDDLSLKPGQHLQEVNLALGRQVPVAAGAPAAAATANNVPQPADTAPVPAAGNPFFPSTSNPPKNREF